MNFPTVRPAAPIGAGTRPSLLIFCVGFVVLLAIALLARLLFIDWRSWFPGAEAEKSLIGGVTSAVYGFMSVIP